MSEVIEPRLIEANWNTGGVQYHEYTCAGCGKLSRNTYSEPTRTRMLEARRCFGCDFWVQFEKRLERNHTCMTIIEGHVYTPGNGTSGRWLGMAGRRFDIEYIEPSVYAGTRITTFDLWSGSTMPDRLIAKYPDTARFLGDAERTQVGETTCWNGSYTGKSPEPYPLPRDAGIKEGAA